MRRPGQGVANIVRFNWHFFAAAGLAVVGGLVAAFLPPAAASIVRWASLATLLPVLLSLAASYYVYDRSGLYDFGWLERLAGPRPARIANIHAGFDETSGLLLARFPEADLAVLDFYDPRKHTEVSVERARRAYPAFPGTRVVATDRLPLADDSTDLVVLFLAAHEIRDEAERARFFQEVNRILTPTGRAVVTEHLRDWANGIAYHAG